MSGVFAASRFLVVLAVVGSFLGAAALFVYGLLAIGRVVWVAFTAQAIDLMGRDHGIVASTERLAVELVQLVDVFLLGTVLYLVGLGLHLLFVNPTLRVPPWMAVTDLDDLKAMLVRVIVILVGVTFLGAIIERVEEEPMLDLGVAVALVVAAYALIIYVTKLPDRAHDHDHAEPAAGGVERAEAATAPE